MLTIVTGAPRSGTSAMMQMLHAGGARIHTDRRRIADENNPWGYFEHEKVKFLAHDPCALTCFTDGAIKVIHALAYHLTPSRRYRAIFMRRAPIHIWASQEAMLRRLKRGAPPTTPDIIGHELSRFEQWLWTRPYIEVLSIEFEELLSRPSHTARQVQGFMQMVLDVPAMSDAVRTPEPAA